MLPSHEKPSIIKIKKIITKQLITLAALITLGCLSHELIIISNGFGMSWQILRQRIVCKNVYYWFLCCVKDIDLRALTHS